MEFNIRKLLYKYFKPLTPLVPNSLWRILRFFFPVIESKLAHSYLDGLNGIEIGASRGNGFGLDKTGGSYANVDFSSEQGGKWQSAGFKPMLVNIVANGDDLPFNDKVFDYVLSSHVIEHFFDPIKTLKEWLRVIKKEGYLFIIVPHKERTFDKDRDLTLLGELVERNKSLITINDYAFMSKETKDKVSYKQQGCETSDNTHILIKNGNIPIGWERFEQDDHHHWNVFTTETFIEIINSLNLNRILLLNFVPS